MSRVLLTFSGKHGDIIWSLQAARAKAAIGAGIEFAVMPAFERVLPLIRMQPYIQKAFSLPNWNMQHADYGAQPRIPPALPGGYDEIHHLTYESFPTEPLIWYGLRRLGLAMPEPALPFLLVEAEAQRDLVTWAFNNNHREQKEAMLKLLMVVLRGARFEDVSQLGFDQAARRIQASRFFFGCRSANYVVAMGLGKRCLILEPDPGRRSPVFGCPFGREHMPDPGLYYQFADLALRWMEEPCD